MPGPDWENLKEIFHSAVMLPTNERAAYLDEACNGDLSLRRRVEELLRSHEETRNFVDTPAYQAAAEMLTEGLELKVGWAESIWLKIQSFTEKSLLSFFQQTSQRTMKGCDVLSKKPAPLQH
jgi:hypothetical protein